MVFYGLGRGCCQGRVHWRKLKVQSRVTFYWLSYGNLPLPGLLLGRGESFLLPAEVLVSLPVGDAGYVISY